MAIDDPHDLAPHLLAIVERVAAEISPQARRARVALDSDLERDLGLDSLGRVELVRRLEVELGVRLGEAVLAAAETPRDLLAAAAAAERSASALGPVDAARANLEPVEPAELAAVDEGEFAPDSTRTLLEVLAWHVARHGERRHLLFYPGDPTEVEPEALRYVDLDRRSDAVAAGLVRRGVEPRAAVALMLPSGTDYFAAFVGIQKAGAVPVPLYPPARKSQVEDHLRRQAGILETAKARVLVTFPEVRTLARLLSAQVPGLKVATVAELEAEGGPAPVVDVRADDLAFLQFTSGSTGQPKGVMLTHANLLANLRAIGRAVAIVPGDAVVSWLPLYHDMGLIGTWMGSLYFAMPLTLTSPLTFLSRPVRWLELIHRHRATLSAAPNFAYELCLGKIGDAEVAGLDLASWRAALNGAEPVSPATIRRFGERFAHVGFRAETMFPVYGLAENSLAVTFPPLGREPWVDVVDREALESEGRAVAAGGDVDDGAGRALRFVSCGRPIPTVEVRIADPGGRELPERRQGRIQFRGPSATAGYFDNPEATAKLIPVPDAGGASWLDSGDLGYLAAGELFVTGRSKDVIFRAGRNLYPHELEQAVGEIPGIRRGCVAVFGAPDPATGTERLVVLAETRERDAAALARLRDAIQGLAVDLLGTPADDVALAPPQSVPKTSSGKIRRSSARELYLAGTLDGGRRSLGLQLARLAASGARRRIARGAATAVAALWAAWFWLVAALLVLPVWCAVVLAPGLERRRRVARASARLGLRLAGVPLAVEDLGGADRAVRPGLYAANHLSYLDAIALTAALPPTVAFAAKRELAGPAFSRRLLARLGTVFVERYDPARGDREADKMAAAIRRGDALAIFPEGTFGRAPGLHAFRLGAFQVAVATGAAVAPVAIRGTRSLLRAGSWFPHRTPIEVVIGTAIRPSGSDLAAAVALRDAVRAEVLAQCGEPDAGDRFHELPAGRPKRR